MDPTAIKSESLHEQFMKLPDTLVGEILNGELHASPRPTPRHARAATKIGGLLDGPFDSGKLLKSHAGDDLVRAEPFDAIEIELGVLWT